jgi:hypothetical protein
MDNGNYFNKPIDDDDRAFGKGTRGGFVKAPEFAPLVGRNRDVPNFAPISREGGNVDVGNGERRAAIVTRYRSGSITETHLDKNGSLGNHGAYHYSARTNTHHALKEGGKPAGTTLRGLLIK